MNESKTCLKFDDIKNLDLSETFDCGQCFRWKQQGDEYIGVVRGKKVSAKLDGKCLSLNFNENYGLPEYWKDYFDLDLNYEDVLKELKSMCEVLYQACANFNGIRILNQEPWEALCSFIISQNNNIPRIKGIISRLCEAFGEKIADEYSFPSADKIASLSEDDLKPIRCGFRASYILDAAKKVSSGEIELEPLREMPIEDARETLMKIRGVGPKVAECTLLYGLHRLEAFPMDVWMKKIMDKFFKGESSGIFGKYAGIAQQYLYHYIRSNPYLLEE